jgi:hypothetical protein
MDKLSKKKAGGMRRDGLGMGGGGRKKWCRFGRGFLMNQFVYERVGWFKWQRVQFRGDVEGTTVIDAEMTANELARKTFQAEIFCFILGLSCWEGNNNDLRR